MGGVGGHDDSHGGDEGEEEREVFAEPGDAEGADGDDGEQDADNHTEKEDIDEEDFDKRTIREVYGFGRFGAFEHGFPVFDRIEMAEALGFEGVGRPIFRDGFEHEFAAIC